MISFKLKNLVTTAFITLGYIASISSVNAQTDTMYVMKTGNIIAKYNTKTDLDSIIFYNPTTDYLTHKISLVVIPSGMFIMGSPQSEINRNNNETQFPVSISSIKMSKYEITNEQFAEFLNAKKVSSNGIDPTGNYPSQALIFPYSAWGLLYSNSKWVPVSGYEKSPLVYVTWYGADEFSRYVGGNLPTEAQWEYACRATTTTTFYTGNCLTNADANYNWNLPYVGCSNSTSNYPVHPINVGSYAPNAFGLYDMHGNVFEWCSDWIGTYPTSLQTNPTGPLSGTGKVARGGSWYHAAVYGRAANRNGNGDGSGYSQGFYSGALGFRVVFVL